MKGLIRKADIALSDILSIHRLILKNIDDNNAGRLRSMQVRVSGSMVIFSNPLKVQQLMDQFIHWLHNFKDQHPVDLAALAHYKLVTIHPFTDGNGRTARLLMNLILMQHGYPPAIISPKDRLSYIKALEKAQLGGATDDYLQVIYKAVSHSLKIYLKAINLETPEKHENHELLIKIGDLAKASKESVSTIRYWTKLGLLEVATTTPSGYQLYNPRMVGVCKQIRSLQQQRYNLEEIATLIS